MRTTIPPIERVKRLSVYEDRGYETLCSIFIGHLTLDGYGQIRVGSRTDGTRRKLGAHVVVYEYFNGPVPEGKEVSHLCEQPDCNENTHLITETHRENMQRVQKLFCINDHPLFGDNLYIDPSGHRVCRICNRMKQRRWKERKHSNSI